jgi:tetratricopeptide (TPR) repeat protein
MNEQINLFSEAESLIGDAEQAAVDLDFHLAERTMRRAGEIDPYLSNLQSYLRIFRYLKSERKRNPVTPDFLAAVWHGLPHSVRMHALTIAESRIIDGYLDPIAEKNLSSKGSFVDRAKTLPRACLYMHRLPSRALRELQTLVCGPYARRADLWAYYGDACSILDRNAEAESSYSRALLADPLAVDLFRIQSEGLRRLFARLSQDHAEPEARALLFIHGWLEGIVPCPKKTDAAGTRLPRKIPGDRVGELLQFALCLVMDQSGKGKKIHVEARQRMMEIDPDLFRLYLARA